MTQIKKFTVKDGFLEVLSFRDKYFFRFFIGESMKFFNWGGTLSDGIELARQRFVYQDCYGVKHEPNEYMIFEV